MNDDRFTRNAVRVWLRQVMEEKGWTASEWARLAETSATNITRVLSPVSGIVPTAATIAKLARVAGSQPNLGAFHRVAARYVRLLSLDTVTSPEIGSVIAPTEMSEDAFAVRVTSDAMNTAGIAPGDIVYCEPVSRVPPTNGRTVVAHRADGTGLIGRFQDPWLMPATTNRHEPQPLAELTVVGVVVACLKPVV